LTGIVFCGPTVGADDVRAILPSASCAGPAALGDVYRASRQNPSFILLIDGYFDHRLSVWHKEVLWALSHGQRVYGASSMGALRAAELGAFGMIGVGTIFEQYASGMLEDDDEVAVVHDDADNAYRPRSDALVNIRATLRAARRCGAISNEAEAALLDVAKGLFNADRTYAALLRPAKILGLAASDVAGLRDFLTTQGPTDQKRVDALLALERVRDDCGKARPSLMTSFRFSYTNAWHAFRQKALESAEVGIEAQAVRAPSSTPVSESETAGAAWLERAPRELSERIWVEALERALSLVLADDDDMPQAAEIQAESEAFRRARDLMSDERTLAWMHENDLDVASFTSLIQDEVLINRHRPTARRLALLELGSALRARSEYAASRLAMRGRKSDS
jgi:hypothetical protein